MTCYSAPNSSCPHVLCLRFVLDLHSRVVLKSKCCNDLLSSYINANYIRVSRDAVGCDIM